MSAGDNFTQAMLQQDVDETMTKFREQGFCCIIICGLPGTDAAHVASNLKTEEQTFDVIKRVLDQYKSEEE